MIDLQPKCDRCGKPQEKSEDMSNENWQVFESGKKCECGGTFKMSFEEQP
jgi:hypothetical protein